LYCSYLIVFGPTKSRESIKNFVVGMGKKSKKEGKGTSKISNLSQKSPVITEQHEMMAQCFHGSTRENFEGDFQQRLDELRKETIGALKVGKSAGQVLMEFVRRCPWLFVDDGFCKHIFAWSTSQMVAKEYAMASMGVNWGLSLRYLTLPTLRDEDIGPESRAVRKYKKYERIAGTPAGAAICMHKHNSCDCLAVPVSDAKRAGITEACECCREEFPRGELNCCTRCELSLYCSKECQAEDW
jgi:hypothetical protein